MLHDTDTAVGGSGASKLPHSHSTPAGVDGGGGSRTPPATPKKGGKMLAVRVQMLDDSITMFQVQAKALGRVLFDQVCKQLHLLEADYFGLEYQEANGTKYWLDLEKPLCRQVGLSLVDTLLRFCVKFYTPDPAQLEEEFTRYLYCLQIKRDLAQGLLQCNDNTAALMASYIVQAECGDYVVEDYPDHTYLSTYKFVPNQDPELERRIMENHKKHAGQSPAEADLNLLETSRRCELYGMKMHPAKDHEGVPLNLAVAHMGIVVFQNFTKINTFSWAKIRKISFKRKRFLIKLHPEGYGYYKDTVEFFFEGRNECKNFWKKCVENHGFFRCSAVKHVPRQKTRVLSRGSSFRYSGRTQKQIVEFVRENYVKRQTFQRSQSFRHSSSAHSSVVNVGTSLSAHPLLPLGDNAVAGTPASLSCGSMTLGSMTTVGDPRRRTPPTSMTATSSPTHTADIHDFDTRDFVIAPTMTPSPPLTTSLSPGTSVTSSPQHFYPRTNNVSAAAHHPNTDDEEQEYAMNPQQAPSTQQSPYRHQNTGQRTLHLPTTISPTLTTTTMAVSTAHPLSSSKPDSNCVERDVIMTTRHDWVRSASCRSLRHDPGITVGLKGRSGLSQGEEEEDDDEEEEEEEEDEDEDDEDEDVDTGRGYYGAIYRHRHQSDTPVTRYEESRRVCYSATGSKTSSVDRGGADANVPETRIYSSSYPGTTSSLSTESGGGGSECVLLGATDTGSQDEIVLSHDDLSHDSYELLERDQDDDPDEEEDEPEQVQYGRLRRKSYGRSGSLDSSGDNLPLDERHSPEVFHMETDEIATQTSIDRPEITMRSVVTNTSCDYTSRGVSPVDFTKDYAQILPPQPRGLEKRIEKIDSLEKYKQYIKSSSLECERRGQTRVGGSRSFEYERKSRLGDLSRNSSKESSKGSVDMGNNIIGRDIPVPTRFLEYNPKCQPGIVVGFSEPERAAPPNYHAPVERAKSDPHQPPSTNSTTTCRSKRHALMHQKSIDLTTPAESGGEINISYTLHKRHAMNGTASAASLLDDEDPNTIIAHRKLMHKKMFEGKSSEDFSLEGKDIEKALSIPSLEKTDADICDSTGKKQDEMDSDLVKSERESQALENLTTSEKTVQVKKVPQVDIVVKDRHENTEELLLERIEHTDKKTYDVISESIKVPEKDIRLLEGFHETLAIIAKDSNITEPINTKVEMLSTADINVSTKEVLVTEVVKPSAVLAEVKVDEESRPSSRRTSSSMVRVPIPELVPRKRDRSPILFARARLGLSEGSAFSPVHRPADSGRRAKSLDAPVVSLHSLPPMNAFSSRDDTLDGNGNGLQKPQKPPLLPKPLRHMPSVIQDDEDGEEEEMKRKEQKVEESGDISSDDGRSQVVPLSSSREPLKEKKAPPEDRSAVVKMKEQKLQEFHSRNSSLDSLDDGRLSDTQVVPSVTNDQLKKLSEQVFLQMQDKGENKKWNYANRKTQFENELLSNKWTPIEDERPAVMLRKTVSQQVDDDRSSKRKEQLGKRSLTVPSRWEHKYIGSDKPEVIFISDRSPSPEEIEIQCFEKKEPYISRALSLSPNTGERPEPVPRRPSSTSPKLDVDRELLVTRVPTTFPKPQAIKPEPVARRPRSVSPYLSDKSSLEKKDSLVTRAPSISAKLEEQWSSDMPVHCGRLSPRSESQEGTKVPPVPRPRSTSPKVGKVTSCESKETAVPRTLSLPPKFESKDTIEEDFLKSRERNAAVTSAVIESETSGKKPKSPAIQHLVISPREEEKPVTDQRSPTSPRTPTRVEDKRRLEMHKQEAISILQTSLSSDSDEFEDKLFGSSVYPEPKEVETSSTSKSLETPSKSERGIQKGEPRSLRLSPRTSEEQKDVSSAKIASPQGSMDKLITSSKLPSPRNSMERSVSGKLPSPQGSMDKLISGSKLPSPQGSMERGAIAKIPSPRGSLEKNVCTKSPSPQSSMDRKISSEKLCSPQGSMDKVISGSKLPSPQGSMDKMISGSKLPSPQGSMERGAIAKIPSPRGSLEKNVCTKSPSPQSSMDRKISSEKLYSPQGSMEMKVSPQSSLERKVSPQGSMESGKILVKRSSSDISGPITVSPRSSLDKQDSSTSRPLSFSSSFEEKKRTEQVDLMIMKKNGIPPPKPARTPPRSEEKKSPLVAMPDEKRISPSRVVCCWMEKDETADKHDQEAEQTVFTTQPTSDRISPKGDMVPITISALVHDAERKAPDVRLVELPADPDPVIRVPDVRLEDPPCAVIFVTEDTSGGGSTEDIPHIVDEPEDNSSRLGIGRCLLKDISKLIFADGSGESAVESLDEEHSPEHWPSEPPPVLPRPPPREDLVLEFKEAYRLVEKSLESPDVCSDYDNLTPPILKVIPTASFEEYVEEKPGEEPEVVAAPTTDEEERKDESSSSAPGEGNGKVPLTERTRSEEEASSSTSCRPCLVESSGSSSLDDGVFPPDETAHLADEEETSSASNNHNGDHIVDFPTGFGYPCMDLGAPGYSAGTVFALSRTLSRISERSTTSEQERSDADEDDSTKPSSRSPSVDDESILSSDRQPSLSSDPPSGAAGTSGILSDEVEVGSSQQPVPPQLLPSDDEWPSPPTSSSLFETPVVSHVETFYMEIRPEEAHKVVVITADGEDEEEDEDDSGSSTDENRTLHDDDDDDDARFSSSTTLDGTVRVVVRPQHYSSLSEDTSLGTLSLSEWSSAGSGQLTVRPKCTPYYSSFPGTADDTTSASSLSEKNQQHASDADGDSSSGSGDASTTRTTSTPSATLQKRDPGSVNSTPSTPVPAVMNHYSRNNGEITSLASTDHDVTRSLELTPNKGFKGEMPPNQKAMTEGEVEVRKKRFPIDRAYFIAKEILMTERTYKKDLEVITVWFRDEVSKEEPEPVLEQLLDLLDPLHEAHSVFLREVEQRLATWEGRGNAHLKGDYQRIGDVVLRNMNVLPLYERYLDSHLAVLERLDEAVHSNRKFEQLYRDFELQKVCYLPLTSFVLKPLQRLLHYQLLLDRLLRHYTKDHPDYEDCLAAKNKLGVTTQNVPVVFKRSENFVQLCELQRDLNGFDQLVQPDREFLRQGCLMKLSRKGYQQRMFFLFSDVLLYTNRSVIPMVQFRVHGQMPLRGVMLEEDPENRMGANYCFTIYGGNRALTVAAGSQEEKDKWIEDLSTAVQAAKERGDNKLQYLSLKSCSSSDEVMDKCGEENGTNREKAAPALRSNTTVHVCWHRNTSISMKDQLRAVENQLSGYLLRKFKNSNGWQKLWVVFTNFCLFFYKTFQDDFPLACLPLLGYTVTTPSPTDSINKDYVFKLQFKNHVYFFRAESEYTFGRWMEVISSATQHSGRLRLFSRKDSALDSSN